MERRLYLHIDAFKNQRRNSAIRGLIGPSQPVDICRPADRTRTSQFPVDLNPIRVKIIGGFCSPLIELSGKSGYFRRLIPARFPCKLMVWYLLTAGFRGFAGKYSFVNTYKKVESFSVF